MMKSLYLRLLNNVILAIRQLAERPGSRRVYIIPLTIFFFIGIIFRLWISHLVPQPFVFDQTEYHNFAIQMIQKGLVAWQARLYGYPLFLAVIYKLFGIGNFLAVFIIQSVIDCLTGVLIYLIGVKIFNNKKIAWVSYLLYLFNPFTSVFVVLTLSEVWGIFLMAVILYLIIILLEVASKPLVIARSVYTVSEATRQSLAYASSHSREIPRFVRNDNLNFPARGRTPWLILILTIILGYLPQVRPAFLFYCLFLFLILLYSVLTYNMNRHSGLTRIDSGVLASLVPRMTNVLICILLFILPFTYNIAGNWTYFKQFSPTTVDNLLVREFYISLYVPGRSPLHAKDPDVFPPEVQKIYNEYTPIPQNEYERKVMARKYLNLGLLKVTENPTEFILSRIRKLWYVWEKHFLFYYEQPDDKFVDFATYWGNNLLIFLGLAGFISWFRKNRKNHLKWFGWLVIFTVVYISLVHALSLAEERYSLPGYPLLFLFAGYAVWDIIDKLLIVNRKKKFEAAP